MVTQWWQYLLTHIGGPGVTQVEMAKRGGVDQTSFSRWKAGDNPPRPETVISLARRIGRPPIEALVAAGYLLPDEVDSIVERPPSEPSNEELLQMIRNRMEGASGESGGDTPPISAGRAHSGVSPRVRPVTPAREDQPTPEFVALADKRNRATHGQQETPLKLNGQSFTL